MDKPGEVRQRLIAALEESDARRRIGRAERIEWLSLHEARPSVISGRAETLRLLHEARESFVDGHYVAALLVAVSFIEHALVEELQLQKHESGSPSFSQAIATAENKKLFPADWLVRAKTLSLRRNPFAHLKTESHKHGLGVRIREEGRHPTEILEADAKESLNKPRQTRRLFRTKPDFS